MLETVNEGVRVRAVFAQGKLMPESFIWGERQIVIKKINLTYARFTGRAKLYYFAVSDEANYFKLEFNTENLVWTLLETYVE
jgi:hypothetical protein